MSKQALLCFPCVVHVPLPVKMRVLGDSECSCCVQVYLKFTIAFESGALVELTDMDHYERRLLKPITTDGSLAPTVSEASDFYPGIMRRNCLQSSSTLFDNIGTRCAQQKSYAH